MLMSTGDNFYPLGIKADNSESMNQFKTSFSDIYTNPHEELRIPWLTVLGNHDWYGNPEAQITFGNTNQYWEIPSKYWHKTYTIVCRTFAQAIDF